MNRSTIDPDVACAAAAGAADVTDEAQASGIVRRVLQGFGRLDMLLNVASVGVAAPFQNTTSAEYRRMVDVNILGLLYSLNAALPAMQQRGEGHIVIVSSGTGRYIHPSVVYSGTKHAAHSIRRNKPDGSAGNRRLPVRDYGRS